MLILVSILAAVLFLYMPTRATRPVAELGGPYSSWFTICDLAFHAETRGSGEPAFILVHGFGASTFSWRYIIGELSEIGTVLAYDRPGFGLTERVDSAGKAPKECYAPERQAGHLLKVMDGAGLETAVLIAHSAGSAVAIEAVRARPERFDALILIAPAVFPVRDSALLRLLVKSTPMDAVGPLLMRLSVPLMQRGLAAAWSDPDSLPREALEGYRLPLQAQHWDKGLWMVLRARLSSDWRPQLDTAGIRTLVVTGEADSIISPAASEAVAGELGASFVVLPQTGHLPHEEDPDTFLLVLLDFLEDDGFSR